MNIVKKVYLRVVLFIFVLCSSMCVRCFQIEAANDDEYKSACEEALTTIQGINQDNLKVYIGDVYNVIDTEGKLDGYSLGYYVDDVPYGYAIYDIDSKSVREFVFTPNVSNLYVELEKKAEEVVEVDESNLIDCVVYEGGIDYCTFDYNGNKVVYDEVYDNEKSHIEELNEKSIYYSEYNESGFYMCDSIKYSDLAYDVNEFCIVPDAGLAMVTQDYIKDRNKRDYACVLVSAVSIINWMGRNNGNIINTYDTLWNYMDNKGLIEHNGDEHGISLVDMVSCFKYYFSSISKVDTKVKWDYTVTFNELRSHVGSTWSGELSPCMLGIDIAYDDKSKEDFAHAVTVLSTLKTTNNKYVGIWNGWYYDWAVEVDADGLRKDVNSCRSAYQSLRYISWNDLDKSNVDLDAIYFSNVQSANIKEANTQYVSGNTIEIACYVPNGTKYVYFPTWSKKGYDIVWFQGQVNGRVATVSIDMTYYNKESGPYGTDIYAYDENMNLLAYYGTLYNVVDSSVSNESVINKTMKGYTYKCKLPTGTKYVKFPTWSKINGQDDIVWYDGSIIDNNGNLTGTINIDVSNHRNDGGEYYTQVYACDKYGNVIVSYGGNTIQITDRNYIEKVKWAKGSASNAYSISFYVPTGTAYITMPIWTEKNGQDDIVWYNENVTSSTGYVKKTVWLSEHNNEKGLYNTYIYAYNSKGQLLDSYYLSEILQ